LILFYTRNISFAHLKKHFAFASYGVKQFHNRISHNVLILHFLGDNLDGNQKENGQQGILYFFQRNAEANFNIHLILWLPVEIVITIVPIFAVILVGLLARQKGIMPQAFLQSANRLTYYAAIPAMMLRAIARSDFNKQFDVNLLLGTIIPLVVVYIVAWIVTIIVKIDRRSRGTLIESTMHGNIGYIGFAVVFYFLGSDALAQAGILGGFMMLVHNVLAVIVLQYYSGKPSTPGGIGQTIKKVLGNPIILTAMFGILLSVLKIPLPVIIDRTLGIIGNLALPLALLVIGASLSLQMQTRHLLVMIMASCSKLILLPAVGYWLYLFFDLPRDVYLPGLILLASPVATVVYILASEMRGDPKLAVNVISISTALSAITISLWLGITT